MSTDTDIKPVEALRLEAEGLAADAATAAAALATAERVLAELNSRVETGQEVDGQEYSSAAQAAVLAGVRSRHATAERDAANEALAGAVAAEEQRQRMAELEAAVRVHEDQIADIERLERAAFEMAVALRDAVKKSAGTFRVLEEAACAAKLGLVLKTDDDDGLLGTMGRGGAGEPWRLGPDGVTAVRINGVVHRRVSRDRFDDLRRRVRDLP